MVLVCFAVKEEAKSIPAPKPSDNWRVLVTGMGKKNAEENLRRTLAIARPDLVITSGFAGGLNPELKWNTVVFDEDREAGLAPHLLKLRAKPARFHCSDHVIVTVAEKKSLWQSTGADAVEMESSIIRSICREHKIPSATIRVISDSAQHDLPLDFNALMTPDYRISFLKLLGTLLRRPGKIGSLMLFQKNLGFSKLELGKLLVSLLLDGRG